MLKTVVEEMNRGAEAPFGEAAGEIAIGADQHRDAGERARQHQRLIARFVEAGDDVRAIRHDRHAIAGYAAPVAASEHSWMFALLEEQPGDVFDDRRLATAADAQVADAHDRT